MAQRKLGRGLGALVTLSPASADGTARIDEVTRTSPETSVLALSGRTVEDFFRVMTPEEVVDVRAPAPIREHVRGQVSVDEASPEVPAMSVPAAADDSVRRPEPTLFDPVVEVETAEDATPDEEPAPPAAAPPAPPVLEDVIEDVIEDDALFVDEQVGGLVLPDVEME